MTLIELIAVGIFSWWSVLAGSWAYERTDNLVIGVMAGVLGLHAFTILRTGLGWLLGRPRKRPGSETGHLTKHHESPELAAARRTDRRSELFVLLVTFPAVVIGQLVYAGSRDRVAALVGMLVVLAFSSFVVSGIGRSRSKR